MEKSAREMSTWCVVYSGVRWVFLSINTIPQMFPAMAKFEGYATGRFLLISSETSLNFSELGGQECSYGCRCKAFGYGDGVMSDQSIEKR